MAHDRGNRRVTGRKHLALRRFDCNALAERLRSECRVAGLVERNRFTGQRGNDRYLALRGGNCLRGRLFRCSHCLRLLLFLRQAEEPRDHKGHAGRNRHGNDVLDRMVQVQQDAEDAGHARAGRAQADDRGIQRAACAANRAGDKRAEEPQVDAEDGRFGDTHERGKRSGQRHGFELFVPGLECDCERRAALRDIRRRGQRQPVGQAVGTDLAEVNDRVHMVDARDDRRRIQAAHDERTNTERDGDQPLHAVDHEIFHSGKHRADDGKRQVAGHKYAYQRSDEQIKHGRYDLVQALFEETHHPHGDDDRDHMSLITDQRHLIQTEKHFLICMYPFGCHRPCVLQVGVQHNHADDRSEERVSAEYLCRGKRDQDGQKGIRHIGKQLREHIDRAAGVHLNESIVDHEVQGLHNTHQETGCHNRRDDRHKDIAQRLDRALEPVTLGCTLRLGLVLADRRRTRERDELVIHFIDRARTEDDLKLALRLKHALHAGRVFQLLLVYLAVVRNDKAQPRCTVRCGHNVVLAADVLQYLGGRFFVIHLLFRPFVYFMKSISYFLSVLYCCRPHFVNPQYYPNLCHGFCALFLIIPRILLSIHKRAVCVLLTQTALPPFRYSVRPILLDTLHSPASVVFFGRSPARSFPAGRARPPRRWSDSNSARLQA